LLPFASSRQIIGAPSSHIRRIEFGTARLCPGGSIFCGSGVEWLEELGASNAGFAKEIDHLLTRVAEIGKRLGIDK
jgi:hypothetical protein